VLLVQARDNRRRLFALKEISLRGLSVQDLEHVRHEVKVESTA
jgi:hypothetical protein